MGRLALGALRVSAATGVLLTLGACGGEADPATREPEVRDPRDWVDELPGLFGRRRDTAAGGVVALDESRVSPGPVLTSVGDRAQALLIESNGRVVHQWARPYGLLPGAPQAEGPGQMPWRRVAPTPDGGLVAIHDGRAIVSIDADSQLRWCSFVRAHDDVATSADGAEVLALVRVDRTITSDGAGRAILDECVVRFDASGAETGRVSLWDALERSSHASALDGLAGGDVLHARSIEVVSEAAAAGLGLDDVGSELALVTLEGIDRVVVVDLDDGVVHRAIAAASCRAIRDATIDGSGHVVVFDGRGGPGESSRVVAIDPANGTTVWTWPRADSGREFASWVGGAVQALPGGHVLACESTQGRAVEFDPSSGEVVWEYVHSRFEGLENEYAAALLQADRIR